MVVRTEAEVAHYNGSPVASAAGPDRLDAHRAATEGDYTFGQVLFPWFSYSTSHETKGSREKEVENTTWNDPVIAVISYT
ncbi:hypothetical protein WN48_01677 [Eufriesea mexicana]|uniref:Uncharacterized protein n=1 Tax=Eufriesea mexicana TaxID=516756 RepID=A0A310SR92_9HYME|nr:hypothetical protein WN48_01677 [Eufriesea mexicana]